MAKFHSSKSTKPLVPEEESKPTTPDLNKPTKKPVSVSTPANEVHWITKPNSAMQRVDEPTETSKQKSEDKEPDKAEVAKPTPETKVTDASTSTDEKADKKTQPEAAETKEKTESGSKWIDDQPAKPEATTEQLKDAQAKELAEAAALAAAAAEIKDVPSAASTSELPKEFQISHTFEEPPTSDKVTPDAPTPPVEVVTDSPQQSSGRNKKIIIATIIIILLLIGAGVGGWLVLGSNDGNATDASASTTTDQASTSADVESETEEPTPTPSDTPEATPTPSPVATATPAPTTAPTVAPTSSTTVESLWLTAVKATAGAQLSWKLEGSAPQGIDVIWSKSDNPTVPNRAGDQSVHVGPGVTSHTVTGVQLGQTYYFRVGVSNTTGGTRWYSNSVAITF